MKIRIAGIVKESVVDGPGLRYVVFTQGCFHKCPGCHNPETHDPSGGYEVDTEDIIDDIRNTKLISGVTFSGGEPFLQCRGIAGIAEAIKDTGLNIAIYTGYMFEELYDSQDYWVGRLLETADILIDGRFKMDERDISLRFRGSRNQRIIDVKNSLKLKCAVILME